MKFNIVLSTIALLLFVSSFLRMFMNNMESDYISERLLYVSLPLMAISYLMIKRYSKEEIISALKEFFNPIKEDKK